MMRRSPMPRRRKNNKPRRRDRLRVPQHLTWIRGHYCIVPGCKSEQIEASHCRNDIPLEDRGGMGMKPHDKWTCPKCTDHHREYHQIGHESFEKKYGIVIKPICAKLWQASPHRIKYERQQEEMAA